MLKDFKQFELIRRTGVFINVNVGSEAHALRCHATPKINFYHLKKGYSAHVIHPKIPISSGFLRKIRKQQRPPIFWVASCFHML